MTQTRVYIPLTAEQCKGLARDRRIALAPPIGHAVTRALTVAQPGLDQDDLEHLALQEAAMAALQTARGSGDRVVVAAADVDPSVVEDGAGQQDSPSRVRVLEYLELQRVASFHLGDHQGSAADDDDSELELSWYDATELDALVTLL